jgi:hypothetical protein
MEESIQPATDADRAHVARHEAVVLEMLQARYGRVQLRQGQSDLELLQRLSDDGVINSSRDAELESIGIVFGQVLAAGTPLQWITIERRGERKLALRYPNTTVIVFPGSMLVNRANRKERLEFRSLYREVVDLVEQLKNDPEYKR